jgi:hypothetical protein
VIVSFGLIKLDCVLSVQIQFASTSIILFARLLSNMKLIALAALSTSTVKAWTGITPNEKVQDHGDDATLQSLYHHGKGQADGFGGSRWLQVDGAGSSVCYITELVAFE